MRAGEQETRHGNDRNQQDNCRNRPVGSLAKLEYEIRKEQYIHQSAKSKAMSEFIFQTILHERSGLS